MITGVPLNSRNMTQQMVRPPVDWATVAAAPSAPRSPNAAASAPSRRHRAFVHFRSRGPFGCRRREILPPGCIESSKGIGSVIDSLRRSVGRTRRDGLSLPLATVLAFVLDADARLVTGPESLSRQRFSGRPAVVIDQPTRAAERRSPADAIVLRRASVPTIAGDRDGVDAVHAGIVHMYWIPA